MQTNSMQCVGLIVDMQVLAPQTRDTGRIYVSIKSKTSTIFKVQDFSLSIIFTDSTKVLWSDLHGTEAVMHAVKPRLVA